MRALITGFLLFVLALTTTAQNSPGNPQMGPGLSFDTHGVTGSIMPSKQDQKRAQDLLERARTLAQGLSDTEKAITLSRITNLAPRIAQTDFAKDVAEELFKASLELPGAEPQRDSGLMQAINAMSALDVDRALVLLRSFPPSDPAQITSFANNRLDAAASRVFQKCWEKQRMKAVPALREAAQQLAATDHYPFAAMAPIVTAVAREELAADVANKADSKPGNPPTESLAEALFREALDTYRNGDRSLVSDVSFSTFVRSTARLVPRPLAQQAVEAVVRNLLTSQPSPRVSFRGIMETRGGGTIKFDQPADFYLYRLLNGVGDLADGVKQKVFEAHPAVEQALDTTARINSLSVREQDDSRSTLPPDSRRAAERIDDPSARAETMAKIALGASGEDASKALEDALKAAGKIPDKREQLRVFAVIASAAERAQQHAIVPELLQRGFAVADDAIREDTNEQPNDRVPRSFSRLEDLARLGMKHHSDLTLTAIDGVNSSFLKAMLLAGAAEGLLPTETGMR